MRRLMIRPTGEYWQHQVFPNLLFSFTDAISLCHCVIPTGPRTSRAIVRQFGRTIGSKFPVRRLLARAWGGIAARITKQILREDMALFGDVQRGLNSSPHRGVLGTCEERIHAFQQFVADRCEQSVGKCTSQLRNHGAMRTNQFDREAASNTCCAGSAFQPAPASLNSHTPDGCDHPA